MRFGWMTKAWTDDAWDDFLYWTEQDKKTLRQIKKLLNDIDRNGYKGIGTLNRLPEILRDIGVVISMKRTV